MYKLQIDILPEFSNILNLQDESALSRRILELAVVELFREEKLSFDQAAEFLVIPKIEFVYLLHRLKVPYFNPILEQVEKEIDVPEVSELPLELDDLLQVLVEHNASDLHIKVGSPPIVRLERELLPIGEQPLTKNDTKRLILGSMDQDQRKAFHDNLSINYAYTLPSKVRFRVNAFYERETISAAFRMLGMGGKSFTELHLPESLKQFTELKSGLVLVCGPAGAGKSTTLSAIINHINRTRKLHVVTIEDPIEFVHEDKMSIISQREVGIDTKSFADALKQALRQDPNVILIGEMRDQETIETAALAAETGHLVFSTIHSSNAVQAIERVQDVFSGKIQEQFRQLLSNTLKGVVAMKLMNKMDASGLVPAVEVMFVTPTIKSLISENKISDIYEFIVEGQQDGMQTFTESLMRLIDAGLVSREDALFNAEQPTELRLKLDGHTSSAGNGAGGHALYDWL
jgi:twitching motility protein PilT